VQAVDVLSDPQGGRTQLDQFDLTANGLALNAFNWGNTGQILATVDSAITIANSAAAQLGTQSKSLATAQAQATNLQQLLQAEVGNLVDADLARSSAQLQALQTKQALGVQALAIANSEPATLLPLFRTIQ
jgi:flagellin